MISYLLVGHFAKDIIIKDPLSCKIGGGVYYSGIIARKLGADVKVLSSYSKEMEEDVLSTSFNISGIPSARTTTFENIYQGEERVQYWHESAEEINEKAAGALSSKDKKILKGNSIIQFAPIADEVKKDILEAVEGEIVGATLQGWLRGREDDGKVFFNHWKEYKEFLPLLDIAIASEEDVRCDYEMIKEYSKYAKLLVITRGGKGCSVIEKGGSKEYSPKKVIQGKDYTGAGDAFAAGYLMEYYRTRDPYASAIKANDIAAEHIEREEARF
ncbi:MAG: PfkB family carbohydrate kinase [Candidatus Paceibacterota bacterium]